MGEIRNEKRTKSVERQKVVFWEEVSMKKSDIEIAREDIANLEKEIDERRDDLQEVEYIYTEAQIDYDSGLIDESVLSQHKEELERRKIHIEDTEAMLETKFKDIVDYQDRIEELEALINQLTDILAIKAPFDGLVSKIFTDSGQIIDREALLLEITSDKLLSIQVDNKLPFSLDGKKVKIAFEDNPVDPNPVDPYTGTLQIERFVASSNQAGGKTLVKVLLEQNLQGSLYEIGKKVTLFCN